MTKLLWRDPRVNQVPIQDHSWKKPREVLRLLVAGPLTAQVQYRAAVPFEQHPINAWFLSPSSVAWMFWSSDSVL